MENLSLKLRVKKMDGVEKKSGSRKRLTSVGFHSDDDEPIGSFFKLKSKRNGKKLKVGLDGGNDRGKEIDVREDKMLVGGEAEDFGGMDDTLASFRKKLKGPRKDSGSAIMMGRNLDINVVEPSGQCLEAPVDKGDLGVESISRIARAAQVIDHGGDERNVDDDEIESKGKGNLKRLKIASRMKQKGSNTDLDDSLNGRRIGDTSRQNHEENVLGSGGSSDQFLDENLEDSLSAFFRKAQSGLIRKSRSSSSLKQTREGQVPKDPNSDDSSEEFPVFINGAQCASKVAQKFLNSEDNLQQLSSRSAIDSDLNKSGIPLNSDDNLCHSVCMEGDLFHCEPREQLASAKVMGSSDNEYGKYSEAPLEDSVPVSLLQMPQSCLSTCSNRTAILQDGEVNNKPTSGIQEGPTVDLCGSDQLYDGEPKLEIRNYEDDLKNCLRKASDFSPDGDVDINGKIVSAKTTSENSSPYNEKKEVVSKFEGELDSFQHLKDFQQPVSDHAMKEESCSYDTSNQIRGTCVEEPDLASVSSQKDDMSISDSRFSPLISLGAHKSEFSFQKNHREKSPEPGDKCDSYLQELCRNESATSNQKRGSSFYQDQTAGDATKGVYIPSQDYFFGGEDGNEDSSPSTMPDRNEDGGSMLDPENKNNKQFAVQRAPRNVKKCRHGDMAYEGDVDWEILIHEQGFLEGNQVGDSDQFFKRREKLDSSSAAVVDSENGGAAAVSAGLKARAAGPVEKIKFKEVLKQKGGLQEYLECRNQILGLWSKDVSRILPLTDCGVTATPLLNEPPSASLIREIYAFLDYNGYINAGVALEKERAEPRAKTNLKFIGEKILGEKSSAPVSDSDDGVSSILGGAKSSDASLETKNGIIYDDEDLVAGATRDEKLATVQTAELYTKMEPEEFQSSCQENGFIDAKLTNGILHLDISRSDPSKEVFVGGIVPGITREFTKQGRDVYSSIDCMEGNHQMQSGSDVRNRVIVIGAGPAGLTAARHLQRQGFSVNVLEARSRIGGRVYTDRSSLSVPVDLGASIITGVEADVATERRPDPSSLICSQLGLELTVLNSDCPLYDIVTCQKVPADLDEALEAEYNGLLDDMVLLVAQKGEQAMKMSLEDGLEYALKRRRMARLGRKYVVDLHTSQNLLIDESISDGKASENYNSGKDILNPLERRVMDWHFANLEYGCAALLKKVSLPYWNQDDVYGGFGGAHCMVKGGYSTVVESLGDGLCIHLNHMVTDVSYRTEDNGVNDNICHKVTVSTSNGREFSGDAVLVTVPLGCLKAETIKFSPRLPQWKHMSIQRLGFGVLNKVVLEFLEVFWDDSVDYFGATAEETNRRGQCFMFWNVKKTVGAPVLIALLVGQAAIDGQNMSSSDHVNHALMVLRKLFGEAMVPDPVASVVTDWGRDPFSYGAYSYVAVGSSGEDYDILGRPVDNCLFFAGEATCKEHPDTVGGAMMSGLREAVRIVNILRTGNDYTAEVEAMEAAQRHSDSERNEVRDIMKRLEAVEISNVLYKNSLDGSRILTREALLQDMFFNAKTMAGRLYLAKDLLNLPLEALKSFAGTKEGLSTLNSWILDSLGKDGTQLLRHCVRLLVLISTDLLAVRLSGIGKTIKEKVCVHTSRDIRAIASQLVSVWIEVFRKEKASNRGLKLRRHSIAVDASRSRSNSTSGKVTPRVHHGTPDNKGKLQVSAYAGSHIPRSASTKMVNTKPVKLDTRVDLNLEVKSSQSQHSVGGQYAKGEEDQNFAMSEEEQAAFAAAEAARAAALAAAEAYASSEAKCNTLLQLPKIPSFHKFARREQYAQMEESDVRRKWPGGAFGRQDCLSEIDSRNCRVRDWSVDFSAACVNLDSSKLSVDNLSQRSHSNEIACHLNFREHSGESLAVDSSIFTKAWVDAAGSVGIKDHTAIERWQSQAAAADSDFYSRTMHIRDEEYSNTSPRVPIQRHKGLANESSVSQVTTNKEFVHSQPKGAELIKRAVVDYVASLLMPLYKARKIDKEGYKSIMKKTATKVMEQTTDAEKAMAVYEFLDFKRKNKIRSFVDKLIEMHMAMKPVAKT